MLFNSLEFFLFLPIVLCLYWGVLNRNLKLQNAFIVLVSYIFYGWWDWKFLILIAFTSFCSYASGVLIARFRAYKKTIGGWERTDSQVVERLITIANIIINLTILGFFKYFNFFVGSFVQAFSNVGVELSVTTLKIILPVGISFYTFQALSYSIDVFRKKIEPTRDVVAFFAFISFFPQLVAGPIERATNLLPQFQQKRTFDTNLFIDGCRLLLWGLFVKMVIADNCGSYVDAIYESPNDYHSLSIALGMVLYSFQIYADFFGYSTIAIGVAKMLNFRLMDNFNTPYMSKNVAEFWRRWHISLSTWFRDYVYFPLGGNRVSLIHLEISIKP